MGRRAKDTLTPEQQYAAERAAALRQQADEADYRAAVAGREIGDTAWNRGVVPEEVLAVPRRDLATARRLRAQAEQAEPAVEPKKRRWF
ncbi:hypothetical protein [Streptomyces sp. NPDC020747]|uniref:hypothetical protein n=1 Tax=Streptomyces sp. NPDC020747 TaxID=3365086 RepID=UPI0037AE0504